jgi:hypothetical protein
MFVSITCLSSHRLASTSWTPTFLVLQQQYSDIRHYHNKMSEVDSTKNNSVFYYITPRRVVEI